MWTICSAMGRIHEVFTESLFALHRIMRTFVGEMQCNLIGSVRWTRSYASQYTCVVRRQALVNHQWSDAHSCIYIYIYGVCVTRCDVPWRKCRACSDTSLWCSTPNRVPETRVQTHESCTHIVTSHRDLSVSMTTLKIVAQTSTPHIFHFCRPTLTSISLAWRP